MPKENAIQHFRKGLQLRQADKLKDSLEHLSKAITADPEFADAYLYRGQVYAQLGNTEQAETDLQLAKSLLSGKTKKNQKNTTKAGKVDLGKIDAVSDDLNYYGDELDFEDDLYDYAFSDESLESDDLLESLIASEAEEKSIPGILEYLNGEKEEVPWIYLFEPSVDELTLVHKHESTGKIISFDQLVCIRLTRAPSGFPRAKDSDCHTEVIETVDGNIFHETICPEHIRNKILFGFSTKQDTKFPFTLIPLINVKKRFQRRHLGNILLEKNLIATDVLKNALSEHSELKKIKFGRVLAEQANLIQSAVEAEIQKAYRERKGTHKVGEILLNAGLVNEEQIQQALTYQKRLHNTPIGHFLIEKGILQEKDLYMALAEKFRIPFVDLRKQKGSKKVISLLPTNVIKKLNVLPLSVNNNTLTVATLMPDPAAICEVVLKHTPMKDVEFVLVQPSHLKNVIKLLFQEKK